MAKNNLNLDAKAMLKRIGLCVVAVFPFLIIIGLLLENKIANGWIIAIFVAIMLVTVLTEELIYALKKQKNSEKPSKHNQDVFK